MKTFLVIFVIRDGEGGEGTIENTYVCDPLKLPSLIEEGKEHIRGSIEEAKKIHSRGYEISCNVNVRQVITLS